MNQLRTTSTTAPGSTVATRKAKDPAEQAADQFASMFASVWLAPPPQPPATPVAKPQEPSLSSGIASPEIPGANSTPVLPASVISSQTLASEIGSEASDVPETLLEEPPIAQPLTTLISSEPFTGLAVPTPQKGIALPTADFDPARAASMPQMPAVETPETALTAATAQVMDTRPPPFETLATSALSTPSPLTTLPSSELTSNGPSVQPTATQTTPATAGIELASSPLSQPLPTPPAQLQGIVPIPAPDPIEPPLPPGPGSMVPRVIRASTVENLPVRPLPMETTPVANVGSELPSVWLPHFPLPQRQAGAPMTLGGTMATPIQPGIEAAAKFTFTGSEEATTVQVPPIAGNTSLPEQALQSAAACRDANLLAGYLAETMRNDRGAKGTSGLKMPLGDHGFDLAVDETSLVSDVGARLISPLAAELSFATAVRDLQTNGQTGAIGPQDINQIIAQAEALRGRQTRSMRLSLRPAELGEIDIQISRDAAGRISAHISAERESARVALSRSIDQLRETLSRAGLTVDKIEINARPDLFAGNRENNEARSNHRESQSVVANLLVENETQAGGRPRAEEEKLLSLRA